MNRQTGDDDILTDGIIIFNSISVDFQTVSSVIENIISRIILDRGKCRLTERIDALRGIGQNMINCRVPKKPVKLSGSAVYTFSDQSLVLPLYGYRYKNCVVQLRYR